MKIERRLQVSGILVITGLIVELATLRWSHPTAFLSFIFFGGALMAAGILFYLYSLVATGNNVIEKKESKQSPPLTSSEISSTS
jgi:TRAP-type C4-dicarboxylate transport system permease small subunit